MERRHDKTSLDNNELNEWCCISVTVVSQWCFSGVTMVLQWCFCGVTVVFQCCFSDVLVVFQWSLQCFSSVSMVLQRRYSGVWKHYKLTTTKTLQYMERRQKTMKLNQLMLTSKTLSLRPLSFKTNIFKPSNLETSRILNFLKEDFISDCIS